MALASVAPAAVTINITAGIFASSEPGNAPFADGRLVQLIASSSDAVFSAPTFDAFVSGDDVVLGSGAVDSSILTADGSAQFTIIVDLLDFPGLNAGDPLLLRWYDIDESAIAPGYGATYNEFRSDDAVDGGDAWLMIGSDLLTLTFGTEGLGGSQPDFAGYASLSTAAIPEPAMYSVLTGALVLGVAALRRRSARHSCNKI